MPAPAPLLAALLVAVASAPAQEGGWLPRYDLSRDEARTARLPSSLAEVSGLATDAAGRLFAHQDEGSTIYRLDPADGRVLARFHAGGRSLRGDFEGLAIAGERFFLITSDGLLLEFEEAADGEVAPARERPTGLGERCELEGLAWEGATDALLVPCKTPRERELRGHLVVFRIPLATLHPDPAPRVLLPLEALGAVGLDDDFHPAAIEVHPVSGTIFLAAAQEEALLELSPAGEPLAGRRLARGRHPQTEGIAFGTDLSLLLADERGAGGGLLTVHPLGPAGGRKDPR